jgi:2-polyprenyl-3-methyl-5-hydroxy-6-metoxy-1,4-benzoquinol methylase
VEEIGVKKSEAGQTSAAIRKNADFFAENDWYKSNQGRLATYRLIAESAAYEVKKASRILDVGNSGIFAFPIDHISRVEAIDLFVDKTFSVRHPDVHWRKMSVLDLKDEDEYDTIIAINCLHHVIGKNVAQCYENLTRIFEVTFRALEQGGNWW